MQLGSGSWNHRTVQVAGNLEQDYEKVNWSFK